MVFVFSVKTSKKQLISSLVCVGLAAIIAIAAWLIPSTAESTAAQGITLKAENEEERLALLKSIGLEADEQEVQVQEIRLPDEMDAVLRAYNALQKQAGLDIEPYLGKRVKVYTYHILNSENPQLTVANMYVYRNKVVAGDLSAKEHGTASEPLFKAK